MAMTLKDDVQALKDAVVQLEKDMRGILNDVGFVKADTAQRLAMMDNRAEWTISYDGFTKEYILCRPKKQSFVVVRGKLSKVGKALREGKEIERHVS